MNAWTCQQVEPLIDLYAADECDARARAAVERHLAACPACQESSREAQQLLGLLDQRFQESERLQRLWSRLESEPRRARRPMQPFVWRVVAAAALVLMTFGLSGWFGPAGPTSSGLQLTVVANPPNAPGVPEAMTTRNDFPAKAVDNSRHTELDAAAVQEYAFDLQGKTPAEFRRALRESAGTDRLPPPPAVDLSLTLHNGGREVLPLRFSDEGAELTMEWKGPGAVSVPAPGATAPLPDLGVVRLAPGETLRLPIPRLAYGSRGAVRYAYWTEPGDYLLTITLRVPVETNPLAAAREIVTTSGPIRVRISDSR